MENLIKEILNKNYEEKSYENNSDMLSNFLIYKAFAHYCESEIPNFSSYIPSNIQIELSNDSQEENSKNITLNKSNLFIADNKDFLINLRAIACHIMENTQIDNFINHKSENPHFSTFIRYNDESFDTIYNKFHTYLFAHNQAKVGIMTPEIYNHTQEMLRYTRRYLNAIIWSQPCEMECELFSINVIGKLLHTAENMNLTEEERNNLQCLQKTYNNISENYNKILENNKMLKDFDLIREQLQRFVKDTTNNLLSHDKNYIRRYSYIDKEIFDKRLLEDPFSLYDIIAGLEINYNDSLAHEILQMLLRNKNEIEHKDNLISQIVAITNIELTPEEEIAVRKWFEKTVSVISFEDFMNDKNKLKDHRNNFLKEPTLIM